MLDKKNIMELDGQEWQSFYDNKYMRVESLVPFEHSVKEPSYRFGWVIRNAPLPEGAKPKALDVGCNHGVLVSLFQQAGYDAYGMDVSEAALEAAQKNVNRAVFVHGFADQRIPFDDGEFDVVSSCEVLEHVKDLEKFISEMVRVTKEGGKILCTTPVGKAFNCPEHVRYFDFYMLEEAFAKYGELKICRIFKQTNQERDRFLYAIELKKGVVKNE